MHAKTLVIGAQFLVTTPGASATRWVSFALAARRDVYVTHGKFALDSVTGSSLDTERHDGDHGSLTRGNALRDFYAARTLAEIFDAYRAFAPAARAHGNVHTFTVHELLLPMRERAAAIYEQALAGISDEARGALYASVQTIIANLSAVEAVPETAKPAKEIA